MPFDALTPLVTERLVVRPVDEADLADLLAVNSDAEVVRFLPYAAWQTPADAQAWLGRMRALEATGSGRQFVLALRGDGRDDDGSRDRERGRAIGTLLVFRHDAASARAEIGYVLGRAHWRRGLMREALHAFCAAAFVQAGLRRIEAEVRPDNEASNRLLAALGFTLEGRLRQRWQTRGEAYDVHHWGLLAGELVRERPGRRP